METTEYNQIYFDNESKRIEPIQTCAICVGMLLEVKAGQTVTFDLAVLSTCSANNDGSFAATLGKARTAVKTAVHGLNAFKLTKVSGQVLINDGEYHLKLDKYKNKLPVKEENMLTIGDKLEGCHYVYGVVLNIDNYSQTTKIYNLKSPLDFDFFISIYTYSLTSVLLINFYEFKPEFISRLCEIYTILIVAYHLCYYSSILKQGSSKKTLHVSSAIEIVQTDSIYVNFESLLDHKNAEVSHLVLSDKIKIKIDNIDNEQITDKDKFKQYVISLLAVNSEILIAVKNSEEMNLDNTNENISVGIGIFKFLRKLNIEFTTRNDNDKKILVQFQHTTIEIEIHHKDEFVTAYCEREIEYTDLQQSIYIPTSESSTNSNTKLTRSNSYGTDTHMNEKFFLIFNNISVETAYEWMKDADESESRDALGYCESLGGGYMQCTYLYSKVDEETLESAKYALKNKRDTIGNSECMQMLVANLETRVTFLGSTLMIPVLDQGALSFIDQLRAVGKKIVCLVEELSPYIKLRVKGKDQQNIHKELIELTSELDQNRNQSHNTIPYELYVAMDSYVLMLKSPKLLPLFNNLLNYSGSVYIVKSNAAVETWDHLFLQSNRLGYLDQAIYYTNNPNHIKYFDLFKITASNCLDGQIVDVNLGTNLIPDQITRYIPLDLANYFALGLPFYIYADMQFMVILASLMLYIRDYFNENNITTKLSKYDLFIKMITYQVVYLLLKSDDEYIDFLLFYGIYSKISYVTDILIQN